MIMMNEGIDKVLQALLDTPHAKTVGTDYIYVRCPICGDSVKHTNHPHCSIWVHEGLPLIYHCWICESSGVVNHEFLKQLQIYDVKLYTAAAIFNKSHAKVLNNLKAVLKKGEARPLDIPEIRNKHSYKTEYIAKRLGIPFTNKSLEYLRVITSLSDFLELNALTPNRAWAEKMEMFEKHYVGFLTMDRTCIVFRAVDSSVKLRYIKYDIYNYKGIGFGDGCYAIPMRVDPMADRITFNMTEGIFDILGVFFHVNKANTDNQIYVAVCGSGYTRVVKSFLKKGFMTNLDINIYSDIDKDRDWYRPIADLSPWFHSINLFYNDTGEKDFGVPKDKIKVRKAVFR
jgi:hypothetical protein